MSATVRLARRSCAVAAGISVLPLLKAGFQDQRPTVVEPRFEWPVGMTVRVDDAENRGIGAVHTTRSYTMRVERAEGGLRIRTVDFVLVRHRNGEEIMRAPIEDSLLTAVTNPDLLVSDSGELLRTIALTDQDLRVTDSSSSVWFVLDDREGHAELVGRRWRMLVQEWLGKSLAVGEVYETPDPGGWLSPWLDAFDEKATVATASFGALAWVRCDPESADTRCVHLQLRMWDRKRGAKGPVLTLDLITQPNSMLPHRLEAVLEAPLGLFGGLSDRAERSVRFTYPQPR
jgi:hypothetical protein